VVTSKASVVLRDAQLEDCQRTVTLLLRNGLVVPTEPKAARHQWEWLWRRNPAVASGRWAPPLGWVLECDDQIVGFFGNLPRRYHYDGHDLLACVGTSWALDPAFRARARSMSAAFFDQSQADLLLATTANRSVGRIFAKFSAVPMPQASYQQVLYWIIDTDRFIRSALRKRDVRPPLAAAAGRTLWPALGATLALTRRRPGRRCAGLEPEVIPLSEVDEEFDGLWQRKLRDARRLYASRQADDLRWHFEPGTEAGTAAVIRCRRRGRLEGYVVVVRSEAPDIGLVRARVADLIVAHDDGSVIDALLATGHDWALGQGCHVFEIIGLPAPVRAVAEQSRPFSRTLPTYPFYYKALTAELRTALQLEDAWYPTAYDGDTSLV
jgi:hypothetical protein